MSAENKAVVRRLFQEVWNRGNLEVAGELISPDCVNHTSQSAGSLPGVRGFKQLNPRPGGGGLGGRGGFGDDRSIISLYLTKRQVEATGPGAQIVSRI